MANSDFKYQTSWVVDIKSVLLQHAEFRDLWMGIGFGIRVRG